MTTSNPMSDPIDPSQSPWNLLGLAIRNRREQRNIHLRALAKETHFSYSQLAKWERAVHRPSPEAIKILDARFGADGYLVALYTAVEELDRLRRNTLEKASSPAHGKDEDMERRRLLQLAIASAGLGALGSAGEPVRQLLELSLGQDSRSVEEWELAVAAHLYALRTRSASSVRDDLVVDLLAAERQLDKVAAPDIPEMHRVIAALSALHANTLTRLGEHGAALRWWRTARASAHESGDLQLELAIYATETGHANYGQRDPMSTLRLVQSAHQIAGSTPSLGLALVTCSQAKALALIGRHDEARQALNRTSDLLEAEPPAPGIMPGYWQAGQLPFAESQIFAQAGNEAKASQARDRSLAALAVMGDQQYAPMIHLHDALCTVVNGGIDQGVYKAATVINTLPSPHRSNMITETAQRVLKAVPLPQRDRPAVGEFRQVLALTPATSV